LSAVAQVRFINATPHLSPADVYVTDPTSGQAVPLGRVPYGTTTLLNPVTAGPCTVSVRYDGDTRVVAVDTVLKKDAKVDVIAVGMPDQPDPAYGLRLLVLEEGFEAMQGSTIRMRVVNGSLDTSPLVVDFLDGGTAGTGSLGRFEDTGPGGIQLPSNVEIPVQVKVDGMNASSFTLGPFPAGTEAVLVVAGYLHRTGGDGLTLVSSAGGLLREGAAVYFLNLTSPPVPLDIYQSGALTIDDLSPGQVAQLAPSSPTFCPGSAPQTSADCLHLPLPYAFLPGEQDLLLVDFSPGGGTLFNQSFDPTDSSPQLRFVNAAMGIPAVDVGLLDGGTFALIDRLDGLGYLDDSIYWSIAFPPGTATLAFRPTGTNTVVAFDAALDAGTRTFAVFSGSVQDPAGARLFLLDTSTSPWSRTEIPPNP
jgi:hypothetical protein